MPTAISKLSPSLPLTPIDSVNRPERFLRLPEVMRMTGLSRSQIYRLISAGQFPEPIRLLHSRVVVWLETQIQAWLADQIAAHRNGEAS